MKALVTGSNGFIGQSLILELENQGSEVVIADKTNGIDLNKSDSLDSFGNVDVVFHLAAKTFIPDSFENPIAFFDNNFSSTLTVLEYCRKHNAKIVFPGTYVYGQPEYLPVDEKHPTKPSSPYTTSKLIAESLIQSYGRDFGVKGCILRLFNVYGPGSGTHFLIPKIIKQAIEDKQVNLFDPKPKRDFVFIDDVVEAMILAAKSNFSKVEIFNVGSGISHSIQEVISFVENNWDEDFEVRFSGESRKNDVMETQADISKAKNLLNWSPKVSLNQGISKMILLYER